MSGHQNPSFQPADEYDVPKRLDNEGQPQNTQNAYYDNKVSISESRDHLVNHRRSIGRVS